MCEFFELGQCTRGDRCTFAHGSEQLRPLDVIIIYIYTGGKIYGISGIIMDYKGYKTLILLWVIYVLRVIYIYMVNVFLYGIKHGLHMDYKLILSGMLL